MSIVIFILVLSFLVFIHELGHFIAAIRSGVVVEEFGIGYPPKAFKLFNWRGTDFTLNWIPFGGFVRMRGEEGVIEGSSEKKSEGGEFYAADTWKKLLIILAGPGVNFFFGVLVFAAVFTRSGIPHLLTEARIGAVSEGSPSQAAGVPTNVTIMGMFVGEDLSEYVVTPEVSDVIETILEHRGETVRIQTTGNCEALACEERVQTFDVYARTAEETPENQGSIGVAFESVVYQFYPSWQMPFRGIAFGFTQAFDLSREIVGALGAMVSDIASNRRVPDDVAGPVGIVHQAQETGILTGGFISIISFAALLSINLAVMNVLPIPPLDGGRAILLMAEYVLGRKRTEKVEYYLNYGGYFLLMGLIIVITIRDVIRLFT
ncbi:MAG: site-2 protease family protein [Pseudomonadales bacterium]|nr:site-2 protease family protein [Candidatus Woesebacteria bacterium]MCB9800879.1 site-2 protease family protein [Pseudomonadales bacterium]